MRLVPAILLLAAAQAAMAVGLNVGIPAMPLTAMRQPSIYGDSRYGYLYRNTNSTTPDVLHRVILPTGQHEGFTVCAWMRLKSVSGASGWMTTHAMWCPEPVIKTAPDLLAGIGAHGITGGTNLTDLGGVITVSNFPFSTYTNPLLASVTSTWPRGVYTIDGWASNTVVISLGGTDYTWPAGRVHGNRTPGPTDAVTISGTGLVSIGISQTPCYRYFDEMDGVSTNNTKLTPESCISTQITFCVWRFGISGGVQIYRSDIGRMAAFNEVSQIKTNALPTNGCFDSRGDYKIGLQGLSAAPYDYELFDARVFPWFLDDTELERIHFNGVQEINRRGIPQWR